jgi:ribonuclease VapC
LTAIAVDSSALIAILRVEPEEQYFIRLIADANGACLSAVSLQECAMVLAGRHGEAADWQEPDALIVRMAMEVVPHDAALARLAREAFLRFGKGRHPAALNFGDCASYALAKARGIPLLFKGNDFARTDILAAIMLR